MYNWLILFRLWTLYVAVSDCRLCFECGTCHFTSLLDWNSKFWWHRADTKQFCLILDGPLFKQVSLVKCWLLARTGGLVTKQGIHLVGLRGSPHGGWEVIKEMVADPAILRREQKQRKLGQEHGRTLTIESQTLWFWREAISMRGEAGLPQKTLH